MKILHVEPDNGLAKAVFRMMQNEGGFVHEQAESGEDALHLARAYDYDCILTEIKLPDFSGAELIRRLREKKVATPVIVLAASAEMHDKVLAFKYGADDFMEKPFYWVELAARIHAVVRRARGHAESVIDCGIVKVDLGRRQVLANGRPVHLTAKHYSMVELLALRKGLTISKEMFLNHMYQGRDEPDLKIIDVFICKIRAAFKATCGDQVIETVWGRGYRMPVRQAEAA